MYRLGKSGDESPHSTGADVLGSARSAPGCRLALPTHPVRVGLPASAAARTPGSFATRGYPLRSPSGSEVGAIGRPRIVGARAEVITVLSQTPRSGPLGVEWLVRSSERAQFGVGTESGAIRRCSNNPSTPCDGSKPCETADATLYSGANAMVATTIDNLVRSLPLKERLGMDVLGFWILGTAPIGTDPSVVPVNRDYSNGRAMWSLADLVGGPTFGLSANIAAHPLLTRLRICALLLAGFSIVVVLSAVQVVINNAAIAFALFAAVSIPAGFIGVTKLIGKVLRVPMENTAENEYRQTDSDGCD